MAKNAKTDKTLDGVYKELKVGYLCIYILSKFTKHSGVYRDYRLYKLF